MPTLPPQMDPRQPLAKAKLADQEEVETDQVCCNKNHSLQANYHSFHNYPSNMYVRSEEKIVTEKCTIIPYTNMEHHGTPT